MFVRCLVFFFPVILFASDKSFIEAFATELVEHVACDKVTPAQAIGYIEEPYKYPNAPYFVYEFYSKYLFTPLNIYRTLLRAIYLMEFVGVLGWVLCSNIYIC